MKFQEVYRELSIFIKCMSDYLEKMNNVSIDAFKSLLRSTILGLTFLQKIHKVAHRDIKPLNILVCNNSFKLSDFGESKFYSRIRNEKNTLRGTPLYLAPEIIQEFEKKIISLSDDEEITVNYFKSYVYSLGLVFYEVLLREKITKNIRKNLLKSDFLAQSCSTIENKYSKSVSELLFRMLNPDPENRLDFTDILAYSSREKLISLDPADYKRLNMMQMNKNESLANSSNNFIYIFKVILIGSSGSGKTSILNRYSSNFFAESMCTTLGVDYTMKGVSLIKYGVNIKLHIWDTAGQERYRKIATPFYMGSNAILIVTEKEKEDQELDDWVNTAKFWSSNYDQMVLYLVMNKNDLREGKGKSLEKYAFEKNLKFYSVSAKTGENVDSLFQDVACDIYNKISVPMDNLGIILLQAKKMEDDDLKKEKQNHHVAKSFKQ